MADPIVVWPCEHGDVLVEPHPVPQGYACAICGATATTYVPMAEAERLKRLLGQRGRDAADAEDEVERLRATIEAVLNLTSTTDRDLHGRDVYLVNNWQAREILTAALSRDGS